MQQRIGQLGEVDLAAVVVVEGGEGGKEFVGAGKGREEGAQRGEVGRQGEGLGDAGGEEGGCGLGGGVLACVFRGEIVSVSGPSPSLWWSVWRMRSRGHT